MSLNPCKVCGSDRVTVWNADGGQQAVCKDCKNIGPVFTGEKAWLRAVDYWNRANELRSPSRDPVTGQYAFDGDFARACRCGHPLGVHVAGGFDCLNSNRSAGGDGVACACLKFRPLQIAPPPADGPKGHTGVAPGCNQTPLTPSNEDHHDR